MLHRSPTRPHVILVLALTLLATIPASVSVGVPAAAAGADDDPPIEWSADVETYMLGPNQEPISGQKPLKSRQWFSGQKSRTEVLQDDGSVMVVITRRDLGVSWTWIESPNVPSRTYFEMPIRDAEAGAASRFTGDEGLGPGARLLEDTPLGIEVVSGQVCDKRLMVVEYTQQPDAMTVRVTTTAWISRDLQLPVKVVSTTQVTGLDLGAAGEEGDQHAQAKPPEAGGLAAGRLATSVMVIFTNLDTSPIPAGMFEVPPGYTRLTMPVFPAIPPGAQTQGP